jgi:hypothetical protein
MNLALALMIVLVTCTTLNEATPGESDQPASAPGDHPTPPPVPNSRSPPARRWLSAGR